MDMMSWLKMRSWSGISSLAFGMLQWLKIIPKVHVSWRYREITKADPFMSCGEFRGTCRHQLFWSQLIGQTQSSGLRISPGGNHD